jgi:adenylyltransferase/sulfurtransferase
MRTLARARCKRIGERGEAKLRNRTVAIAGIGAVGSSIANMLAREDIHLRLVDMGRVEEEDMHRLTIFYEEDITKFKVKQAKLRLNAINPNVQIKSFHEEINEESVFLLQGDVIVDASNNPYTNALTFAYAAKKRYPFILLRYSGTAARILVMQRPLPAKILDKLSLPAEETEGIFGPVTIMAASFAVAAIMKILISDKSSHLIECDAWDSKVKITKL